MNAAKTIENIEAKAAKHPANNNTPLEPLKAATKHKTETKPNANEMRQYFRAVMKNSLDEPRLASVRSHSCLFLNYRAQRPGSTRTVPTILATIPGIMNMVAGSLQ